LLLNKKKEKDGKKGGIECRGEPNSQRPAGFEIAEKKAVSPGKEGGILTRKEGRWGSPSARLAESALGGRSLRKGRGVQPDIEKL